MRFTFVDRVLEQSDTRVVAVKQVSLTEEYLADHFPTFPVLPGVLMLETMVQAARLLLGPDGEAMSLGEVRAMRFARFVRPGEALRVVVERTEDARGAEGHVMFRGRGEVIGLDGAGSNGVGGGGVSGRFTLRPREVAAAGSR